MLRLPRCIVNSKKQLATIFFWQFSFNFWHSLDKTVTQTFCYFVTDTPVYSSPIIFWVWIGTLIKFFFNEAYTLFQNGGDPGWSGSSCTKTRHWGPWNTTLPMASLRNNLVFGPSFFTEDDIPGSSLNGRDTNRLKNSELKFWLKCIWQNFFYLLD